MDWLIQHPTNQYTHQTCRKYNNLCLLLFLTHPLVFSAHYYANLLPFRNSYPGSHGTHSSPFRTTVLAFVLVSKKKKYRACLRFSREKEKRFRIRFPYVTSPCVELVCILCNLPAYTQRAGCEALSAVSSYTDAFVSGFGLDPNDHVRHFSSDNLLLVVYVYM